MTDEERKANLTEQLRQFVRSAIETMETDDVIHPALISGIAIRQIDPNGVAPDLVEWGCVLELRQFAREELRKRHDPVPADDKQQVLFDGVLQDRYPSVDGGYAKRSAMTAADYLMNIERLEKNAKALQKHGDALRAEFMERQDRGDFKAQA